MWLPELLRALLPELRRFEIFTITVDELANYQTDTEVTARPTIEMLPFCQPCCDLPLNLRFCVFKHMNGTFQSQDLMKVT
jgi:hypothetical protein